MRFLESYRRRRDAIGRARGALRGRITNVDALRAQARADEEAALARRLRRP